MAITGKSSPTGDANIDFQAVLNDISSLKSDIAALASSLSNGAVNVTSDVTNKAAAQIGDQASRIYDNVASQSQKSAKLVSQQVEAQPITSVLIAFAIGFIGSRLLSNTSR